MIKQPEFDDSWYSWSDNPMNATLTLDYQSDTPEDSEEDDEDEPIMNVPKEVPIDLTMNTTLVFRSYVKVTLKVSDNQQINLTALIDTGAVSSIIHGKCLPKSLHIPTAVSFSAASGDKFYSQKCTRPLDVLPFGKRHTFFTFDQTGEDLLLGTDFLSLVAPYTFHPDGFAYTIVDQITHKDHLFMIPWMKKKSIFERGDKEKIQAIYIYITTLPLNFPPIYTIIIPHLNPT